MGNYILGLDAGNTVIKAIIFDTAGRELAMAALDGRSSMPKPGHVERDLNELWANAVTVIRRCIDEAGIDAGDIAHLLGAHSHTLGSIFAIVLLDASIVGAAAVTLATSYAFGDVFGLKHSLHRGFKDAKAIYVAYCAMVALKKNRTRLVEVRVQFTAGRFVDLNIIVNLHSI